MIVLLVSLGGASHPYVIFCIIDPCQAVPQFSDTPPQSVMICSDADIVGDLAIH
jgi:hypothetical protein